MLETDFRTALEAQLALAADDVRERLRRVIEAIPSEAEDLTLMIFPDPDGEGPFDVRAAVGGPGLHGLNEALGEHAELFCVQHTSNGLEPPVPYVDPFATQFSVNDVVVDCVAAWLENVWQSIESRALSIPVSIEGADGYGTATPIRLANR